MARRHGGNTAYPEIKKLSFSSFISLNSGGSRGVGVTGVITPGHCKKKTGGVH